MKPSTILFLVILAVVLVATVVIGGMAYKESTKDQAKQAEKTPVIPVHVHQIQTGSVENVVTLTGFIEPGDRVDVIAKIPTPGKLISANVKKGETVTKDQVLATVDRDEIGADYMPFSIRAPMDGMVVAIQDDPGSLVLNSRPFGAIVNISEVKVKASIIESDMARIKQDNAARVKVDARPDQTFDGTVSLIESVLDPYAHTAPIEITVSNSGGELLPGMFARIEVVAETRSDVPLIPKRAVFKREGKNLCYVVKEDENRKTRVFLTDLELGFFDGENYEVVSGLVAGDQVVDEGLLVLKDQTEVTIMKPAESPDAAAGSTAEPVAGSTAAPLEGSTAATAAGSTAAPIDGSTAAAAAGTATGATPAEPAATAGSTPTADSTAPASGATVPAAP